MIDKNDPLIGVVQGVMKKNQAEREAVKLVNEKFGIQDRKVLPHERQHEWEAAYKSVLTEGVSVPDVSYSKTTNPQTGSDRRIITKDTKNVFSGGTTTLHKVDKSADGTRSMTTKIKSQDLGKNKEGSGKNYNVSSSEVLRKSSTSVDEETLDEKSFAALAPPHDKVTEKDRLVGAGVLKKHPTQPGKHVLAKRKTLEEKKLVGKQRNIDVASANGEKKPDGKLTSHDFKHLRSMEEEALDEMMIKVNMDHKADHSRLEAKHNVKIVKPEDPKGKHVVQGSKENLKNFANDVYDNHSPVNVHPELFKEGSDVTSPSSMGIKKPNYAPAGTTPDYANKGPQMVNRAAKTSLPAGTVAKSIREAGPGFAGAGSQVRGQSTYGSGAAGQQVGKPRVDAKAQGFPARPAASPSTSGTSTKFGGRPAPSNAINNLGRVSQKAAQARTGGNPTAAPAARPAVGGARPSVVAKNSMTRRGMGWTPSGPSTNAGVTALNKQTSQQVPNSGAAKPAGAAAPAAAAPAPAAAKAAPAAAAPAAKKVTPVRKAAPAAGTAVTRMRQARQREKNNEVGRA